MSARADFERRLYEQYTGFFDRAERERRWNPFRDIPWEVLECRTRRADYRKTAAEWLRRLRANESRIRERWGAQLFADYERYLSTCVRAFEQHWSSDA